MKLCEQNAVTIKEISMITEAETPPRGTVIKRYPGNNIYDRFFYNIGAGSIQTWDNGSIHVEDGDVVYIPRHLIYTDHITSEGVSLIAYLDMTPELTEGIVKWSFPDNRDMRQCFTGSVEQWRRRKSGYYISCMQAMYAALNLICRTEKAQNVYLPSSVQERLTPAVDYMKVHFSDSTLTVPYLASLCGISYSHFRKLFFDVYGKSANQYLCDLRLNHACEMLRLSSYPVAEIAAMSGFSDAYYFHAFFRKYMGVTPIQYRNSGK